MSKPRYKWWGYIKAVIRDYPVHLHDLNNLRQQAITPNYGRSEGHGYEVPRTTEQLALRCLPETEQKELDSVELAIEYTKQTFADADLRLKLVKLVFFTKSHTLQGAADEIHVSYRTAFRWHNAFIRQVAQEFGLLK